MVSIPSRVSISSNTFNQKLTVYYEQCQSLQGFLYLLTKINTVEEMMDTGVNPFKGFYIF